MALFLHQSQRKCNSDTDFGYSWVWRTQVCSQYLPIDSHLAATAEATPCPVALQDPQLIISPLRQEQERIRSLDATAWQPCLGIQIPLISGYETPEQTGTLVASVEENIWQVRQRRGNHGRDNVISLIKIPKDCESYNPIQKVKVPLMESRAAFELLQATQGIHCHSQAAEESDRWKVILDHL